MNIENTLNQKPRAAFGSSTAKLSSTPMKTPMKSTQDCPTPMSTKRPFTTSSIIKNAVPNSAAKASNSMSASIRTPLKAVTIAAPSVTASASREVARSAKLKNEQDRIQKVQELKSKWASEKSQKLQIQKLLKDKERQNYPKKFRNKMFCRSKFKRNKK